MSTATTTWDAIVPAPRAAASLRELIASRLADYLAIAKPRIALMVLITVTVGYGVGCRGDWQVATWLHVMLGVALASASASAFNQYLERRTDALMPRTSGRALPCGRLGGFEVVLFGTLTAAAAALDLALFTNPLTACLALGCIALYVLAYTPLKTRTGMCTVIGAVPGALPPVLGWTAARGSLEVEALALFAILFLWQFPHFLAIAWKYRSEYRSAGLRMLPGAGSPHIVGLLAAAYAVVLLPAALWPRELGLAGDLYFITALSVGAWYAVSAVRFARSLTDAAARNLLLVSLVHLPVVLGVLLFDHWRLLQ
jgi:protoheme IX farnesyltransferase